MTLAYLEMVAFFSFVHFHHKFCRFHVTSSPSGRIYAAVFIRTLRFFVVHFCFFQKNAPLPVQRQGHPYVWPKRTSATRTQEHTNSPGITDSGACFMIVFQ